MTKGKSLIFISMLAAITSCHKETEAPAPETKPAAAKASSTASGITAANPAEEEAAGPGKASDRSAVKTNPPAMGERLPGTNQAKSPYSDAVVDIVGLPPGALIKDPKTGKNFTLPDASPEEASNENTEPPVATAVPGQPGMVFSPFSNKLIDVTGIPAGKLVADPTYPPAENKHFRVPQPTAPAPVGQ